MPRASRRNQRRPKKRAKESFPKYLPRGCDTAQLQWLGVCLRKHRQSREETLQKVAAAVQVQASEIAQLEKGSFKLNLGKLRDILRQGYQVEFSKLLRECYHAYRPYFDSKGTRDFLREFSYRIRKPNQKGAPPTDDESDQPTPFLIGGDPKSFLWAVPMRHLPNQPISVELLELAPFRKNPRVGHTPFNSHAGTEVVHVINGRVTIKFDDERERELNREDTVHFLSSKPHKIQNEETNSPALLLVVRAGTE